MCGRFNNHLPRMHGWAEVLQEWPDVPLSYNVAPTTTIAAFTCADASQADSTQALSGQAMRWGMIPSWSKEFSSSYATFNARVETVADKATFRNAWRKQQRCLIPMAGYYEWQSKRGDDGKLRKQPFYVTDKTVGGLVAGGLFENWGEAGAMQQSCTMITRPADPGLNNIHARMPVLMTMQTAFEWLNCDASEGAELIQQLQLPDLVFWPISKAVGNVSNNDQSLPLAIDLETDEPGDGD